MMVRSSMAAVARVIAWCAVAAFLLSMVPRAAAGDEIALCRIGDVWRFLALPPETTRPGADWVLPGADDRFWSAGPSGFSAGYAANEATVLPETGTNSATVLFRVSFNEVDPARVKWLTLRMDYCDGFVAYLNGQEIARRNLPGPPGAPVPFDQLASQSHARGDIEEINVSPFTGSLVSGTNVLAVQLAGAWPGSVGLCFAAELMANFTRAPYLQNTSSNQVQIIWKTPVLADTRVDYGTDGQLAKSFSDTNLVTTHVATITDLAEGTAYEYRAHSGAVGNEVEAPPAAFRTFTTSGPVRLVVFGDGGWNSLAQYQLADQMRLSAPDFAIEVGDNVYPMFTRALADPRCFSVYGPQVRSTPFFFVLGNHDLLAGVTNYLDAFYLPTNSVAWPVHLASQTSPEHYYSFDVGSAHCTVLYVPFISQYQLKEGDPQYCWLTNDLATTRQPWKLVFYHVPMNSSSAHRFDDWNYNGEPDRLDIRDVLLPVLSRFGVQLVFSGHEHGYERFNPTNGVHFITTAGGGGPLYGFSELDVASDFFWSRYNFVRVTIGDESLETEAVGTGGEVFDGMTIQRQLPPPRVYQAAWHTPSFAAGANTNSNSSAPVPAFDFAGAPIPALAGQFSNLGRAFVNNDQTNLYVGFDRLMVYGNSDLFLFIDSPRTNGPTSLADLGNGIVDPNGQGAEGLDFLANLRFTNFTPTIGCILGDSVAETQSRSYLRSGLLLGTGQGIFRLDSSLSDVSGAFFQQFNPSPKVGGMPGELSATEVQVAIPLAALGDLRPGDVVRLGAVVGGADFDLTAQSRWIDSGFLGTRLTGTGMSPVLLNPIVVRIAGDPTADQDGDGLPDDWEVLHQLDPTSTLGADGAEGDPDADGFSNLAEFRAGTDPRDPNSALRVAIRAAGADSIGIAWASAPGHSYRVQASAGTRLGFQDLPGTEVHAGETNAGPMEVLLPIQAVGQLFRIRLVE